MVGAVASILLGVLGLAAVLWFPTLAIVLGLAAVGVALLQRRRHRARVGGPTDSDREDRLTLTGIWIGTVAVLASILVVILTTR
jgi:hypothetical protein